MNDPRSDKADWERRRDTHKAVFPENLWNWLSLDPFWRMCVQQVVAAIEAICAGRNAKIPVGWREIVVQASRIEDSWTVDTPMVSEQLDATMEWVLAWREEDRLTVMTLFDDATPDKIFWDKAQGGLPVTLLIGAPKPPKEPTKKIKKS